MTGAWMSKGPGTRAPGGSRRCVRPGTQCTQTAHFIVDGAPLCAQAVTLDGRPRFAPFLSSWVELRSFDRRCKICSEMIASSTAHRRTR